MWNVLINQLNKEPSEIIWMIWFFFVVLIQFSSEDYIYVDSNV